MPKAKIEVVVKKSKVEVESEIEQIIKKGCDLSVKLKKMEEEMKGLKEKALVYLKNAEGSDSKKEIVTMRGTAVLTVSKSYSLPEFNLPKVKEAIGNDDFELFFKPKVSYGLTPTCHALLKSDEENRKAQIVPLIEIKESQSVSFKGISKK